MTTINCMTKLRMPTIKCLRRATSGLMRFGDLQTTLIRTFNLGQRLNYSTMATKR